MSLAGIFQRTLIRLKISPSTLLKIKQHPPTNHLQHPNGPKEKERPPAHLIIKTRFASRCHIQKHLKKTNIPSIVPLATIRVCIALIPHSAFEVVC